MNGIRAALLVSLLALSASAGAKEVSISGTHSPDEIKSACGKVGGTFYPQGGTGTYGCENSNNGNMVLCNKDQKCTGYTAARTKSQSRKSAHAFGLKP